MQLVKRLKEAGGVVYTVMHQEIVKQELLMTRKFKKVVNQNYQKQELKMIKSTLSHSSNQMPFAKNTILKFTLGTNIQDNFYVPSASSQRT